MTYVYLLFILTTLPVAQTVATNGVAHEFERIWKESASAILVSGKLGVGVKPGGVPTGCNPWRWPSTLDGGVLLVASPWW